MPSLGKVAAIILAGGKGTRLHNILQGQQKVLLPVCGKPLIQYTIENLEKTSVQETMLAPGMNSKNVTTWVQSFDSTIRIAPPNEKGILSTFAAAARLTEADTIVLCNGDEIRLGLDIKKALAFHSAHQGIATMVAIKKDKLYRHRVLNVDENNLLINSTLKDPLYETSPTTEGLVNIGFIIAQRAPLLEILSQEGDGWDTIIHSLTEMRKILVFTHESLKYFNVGTDDELAEAVSSIAHIENC